MIEGLKKDSYFMHFIQLNCETSIRKSRYDSIDMYLHEINQPFNDVFINYSKKHFQMLIESGVDEILARHVAHLFCRDPISLFHEKLMIDDTKEVDHFEPPPPGTSIGWRVEFRTLEVQFTCFENAMFVIFVVLLSRTLLINQFNFVVPISKVISTLIQMEENMDRAIIRDAVNRSKFFIRKNYKNATGEPGKFVGLIGLIEDYVSNLDLDPETVDCVNHCLCFIRNRANGSLMTPATWIRRYIQSHPSYQHDSLVSNEILYDMTCRIKDISDGKIPCPELLGTYNLQKPSVAYIEAFKKMIKIESMTNTERRREAARILNISKAFENCDDCLIFGC
ncbi:Glutamate--cysteine ligase catalytic subunit [Thelohanellus kitauei]|uniref:Glutamate--cysteine ligase n=1 Tax=Thelohanellus kitauei TaxID=669202 RepID=A0A0C2NI68_THEKT|nr:Glutamate--cysteine ligase catalytic subunit [Thelohanellus kitauei]